MPDSPQPRATDPVKTRPPRIACIAWGSLIWKSGELALSSEFEMGGPALPIEFARVGDLGELATVICPQAARVPTRWALLKADQVAIAREQLRQREQIDVSRAVQCVGDALSADVLRPYADDIWAWARSNDLDAVVWTALPPRYAGDEGRMPSIDEALAYLQGLEGDVLAHAEHYVRSAPAEIDTVYRQAIEKHLGWSRRPSGV